ncbi:MAG: LVIVD repeat-containing protein [Thermoplasmatota archaeon]
MRGRALLAIAPLILGALAGCVAPSILGTAGTSTPTNESVNYSAIEQAIGNPIVGDHNHFDGSLHMAHYNLLNVANATAHNGAPPPDQETYAETAVKNGYAYLTQYGPESGFSIFDVHDIEHPKFVSEMRLDAGFEPDIEVSDDGHWAFYETQRFPTSEETPAPDPGGNLPHGVQVIDISDKAHPKWVSFFPVYPDGPHSITYANISGRDILFLSTYAFAYAYENVEVPTAQRLIVTELDKSGPIPMLKQIAEYRQPGATGGPGLFPHDVSVSVHPFTHQVLAYVAYWNVGMVILNVSDPAHPTEVSTFTDFGPATYRDVHMARPFPNLIDGRQITVIEPEVGGEKDTGYITFADTTDPAHPKYVSSWILPGNVTSQGLTFSPHYFDVSPDGKVALASYHAGVWVIDVHDRTNLLHPRTVAFNEAGSDRVAHDIFGQVMSGAFDAWWYQGHVVAGDFLKGLTVYRYTGP